MFAKQSNQSVVSWTISLGSLLLAAAPALAQFGPGQNGPLWNYRSNYGSSNYSLPAAPVYYPAAPAATSESYYNGPVQNDGRVLIKMQVPEGAKVWFGDAATRQTGANRQFISPPLASGENYVYQVRVQWQDGGQVKDQTRIVTVRAGDRINLDFGENRAQ